MEAASPLECPHPFPLTAAPKAQSSEAPRLAQRPLPERREVTSRRFGNGGLPTWKWLPEASLSPPWAAPPWCLSPVLSSSSSSSFLPSSHPHQPPACLPSVVPCRQPERSSLTPFLAPDTPVLSASRVPLWFLGFVLPTPLSFPVPRVPALLLPITHPAFRILGSSPSPSLHPSVHLVSLLSSSVLTWVPFPSMLFPSNLYFILFLLCLSPSSSHFLHHRLLLASHPSL